MAVRARALLAVYSLLLLFPAVKCQYEPPQLLAENETAHCDNPATIRSDDEVYCDPNTRNKVLVYEWEIICKLKESESKTYTTQIIPEYRFNLYCNLSVPNLEVEKIPRWNLTGRTQLYKSFFIEDCPLPPTSYAETIRFLGFTSTRTLKITRIAGSAALQRKHLKGLEKLNVTELELYNSKITNIPDDLFQDLEQLQKLKLNFDKLNFTGNIFRNLNHLTMLSCSNCGLSLLPDDLFALPALERLFLEDNNLQLQKSTFAQLPSLQVLSLVNNSLKTLPEGVFSELRNLKEIYLNLNPFTCLPEHLFKYTRKLQTIKITHSKTLSEIPDDLLTDMENLTTVDLSHNAILSLPEKVFDKSRKISVLLLSHNKLSNSSAFSALVGLNNLTLSYNKFTNIPDHAFNRLHSLQVLNIDNNMIKTIERDAFQGLQRLEKLNLASNQLSAMDQYDWHLVYPFKLQELDLSNNNMTFIPMQMQRDNLHYLSFLNLMNNHISKIESIRRDLDFKKKQDFRIDLSNNKIQEFCLPDYEEIEFSNNVKVIIKNNPLHCDCKLFSFVEYRMKIKNSSKFTIDTGHTKCATPTDLATEQVSTILPKHLVCEHQHTFGRCSLIEKPYYSAKIINCSNGQLYRDDNFVDMIKKISPKPGFGFHQPDHINHTELILDNNIINNLKMYGALPDEITVLALRNTSLQLNPGDIPSHIEKLDLRDNNMEYLDDTVAHNILFGSENRTVKLSGNYLACDCNNKEILAMLLNKRSENVEDFKELNCSKATSDAGPTVAEVQLATLCRDRSPYLIIGAVAIVSLILVILYYQFKYAIKAWLVNNFEWPRHFLLKKVTVDINKLKKDVFLSYSNEDEEDMDKILMLIQEKGYTTINHRDDWLGGGSILESIVDSIRDSQTTIFLVTPHFVESSWGTHEFRVAFATQVLERSSNIIVIMKGDVDAIVKKDKNLKAYIKRFTYLKWEDPQLESRLTLCLPERLAERRAKIQSDTSNDIKLDGLNVKIHDSNNMNLRIS